MINFQNQKYKSEQTLISKKNQNTNKKIPKFKSYEPKFEEW
jgi:hypothetical protein